MGQVEPTERLYQAKATFLIVGQHTAGDRDPVIAGDPNGLGFGDQIPDGQDQAVGVDQHPAAGPFGTEDGCRESVFGNMTAERHHGVQRGLQIKPEILRPRQKIGVIRHALNFHFVVLMAHSRPVGCARKAPSTGLGGVAGGSHSGGHGQAPLTSAPAPAQRLAHRRVLAPLFGAATASRRAEEGRRPGPARCRGAVLAGRLRGFARRRAGPSGRPAGRRRAVWRPPTCPPVFVFLAPETWRAFAPVDALLTYMLGQAPALLPHFWAWHVPPRPGARGWPRHRDYQGASVIGPPGQEQAVSLSLWLALDAVRADQAALRLQAMGTRRRRSR